MPGFYVYVLDTDTGWYVGSTNDVERRVREHKAGRTRSTRGKNPRHVWTSPAMPNRAVALAFEKELVWYRNSKSKMWTETTGLGEWKRRRSERPIPVWVWVIAAVAIMLLVSWCADAMRVSAGAH